MAMSMRTFPIRFLIFTSLLLYLSYACPQHQKEALVQFKHLIEQSISPNSSVLRPVKWNADSDCCKWVGVTCDSHNGSQQVTALYSLGPDNDNDLHPFRDDSVSSQVLAPLLRIQSLETLNVSFMGLSGKIPGTGISNLSNLMNLDMTGNNLIGNIPVEIGNLSRLRSLRLGENSLSGPIPEWIGNLKELQYLGLHTNSFSGRIPSTLGNLHDIRTLSLAFNKLVGRFPRWIRKMGKLQRLFLEGNFLCGEIPAWLFEIKTLTVLHLGNNNFTLTNSTIHPESNLSMLSLDSCNLSKNIPTWISNFTNLKILTLSGSNLQGFIPHWVTELNLAALDLSDNKLSGTLPPSLLQSRTLEILELEGNNLCGELPQTIGEANALQFLDLSRNEFSGEEFPIWHENSKLFYADFSDNALSGEVPGSFPKGMRVLNLARNLFKGSLPQELGHLSSLSFFDLQSNNITGKIPKFLSRMTNLQFLNLRNNSFDGTIPCQLSRLHQLQILDLSRNKLSAQIPPCLGKFSTMMAGYNPQRYKDIYISAGNVSLEGPSLSDMEVLWKSLEENIPGGQIILYTLLDLSHNQLSGEIPLALGHLHHLKVLNMSHNKLSGGIPAALGDIVSLESLDLSHNQLIGHIPESFSKLTELSTLDLSNNNLTGEIPAGPQMERLNDPNSYTNNSGLCGRQIQVPCQKNTAGTKPPGHQKGGNSDEEPNTSAESWISWQMAGMGFGVGFVSTIFITYCFGFFDAPQTHQRRSVMRRRQHFQYKITMSATFPVTLY